MQLDKLCVVMYNFQLYVHMYTTTENAHNYV